MHKIAHRSTENNLRIAALKEGISLEFINKKSQNKFAYKRFEEIIFVDINDIIYVKAYDHYTYVFTTDGEQHISSDSLKEFSMKLEQHFFYKIHKSFIININKISKISLKDGMNVVMEDTTQLPVARARKSEFKILINTCFL